MINDLKYIAMFGMFVIIVITFLFGLNLVVNAVSFGADRRAWSEFEYVIKQDTRYYYTHGYEEKDGCVYFVDNYANNQIWCEKYSVGENYLHKGGLNWKVLIYGY